VAPNHAEAQGAWSDLNACGPWKGSGGGADHITSVQIPSVSIKSRFISDRIASYLVVSYLVRSYFLLPHRFIFAQTSSIRSLLPHHTEARRPGSRPRKGLGTDHHLLSAHLESHQVISPRFLHQFESFLIASTPILSPSLTSFLIDSALIVPQAPQWPAESWEAESARFNSDQLSSSRFI
jgi:hypothetical protein